jgi:hypothetical protein
MIGGEVTADVAPEAGVADPSPSTIAPIRETDAQAATNVLARRTLRTISLPDHETRRRRHCRCSQVYTSTGRHARVEGVRPCFCGAVDVKALDHAGFRNALLEVYLPRYGPEWETFLDSGPIYTRIEADRIFAFFDPTIATS